MKKLVSAFIALSIATYSLLAVAQVNSVLAPGIRDSYGATYANTEGVKPTYAAAITGLIAASSANDIFYITGSATKTIKVTKVSVAGRATAATAIDVALIKRSTAYTLGTCTAATNVPHDSGSSAATAVVKYCTANPTLGTAVGTIAATQVFFGNMTTTAPGAAANFVFGDRPAQSPTLRGIAQTIGVNIGQATITGNVMDVFIEWTEE